MALTVEQMLYGVWCHSRLRTNSTVTCHFEYYNYCYIYHFNIHKYDMKYFSYHQWSELKQQTLHRSSIVFLAFFAINLRLYSEILQSTTTLSAGSKDQLSIQGFQYRCINCLELSVFIY